MIESQRIVATGSNVIRFSGDSGDGIQLTGSLFARASSMNGHDISTYPDYPSDIRSPKGSPNGVSSYQVHYGQKVTNPGDLTNLLVALNPAALKSNIRLMAPGGIILLDIDSFTPRNIQLAGYSCNDPLLDEKLDGVTVLKIGITSITQKALGGSHGTDSIAKARSMFALGMVIGIANIPVSIGRECVRQKFSHKPAVMEANLKALLAGHEHSGLILPREPLPRVSGRSQRKGLFRDINGNRAIAWGFLYAAEKSNLQLFIGSYPITPATEILQELSERKELGVKVFQAEDEIGAICAAIGASFAGNLSVTTTSGPGLALKSEALGLAVMAELPLVVVNVQRGGPSTGLPTKTEQADLQMALHGRNGESPMVVLAASTPSNCFDMAYNACRIAVEHMTPVILLSDGYLANGSQQWMVPPADQFPGIKIPLPTVTGDKYNPNNRDNVKFRPEWAWPGTKGLEHRIGSLEKHLDTGQVSHDGSNHARMVSLRQAKLEAISGYIPGLEITGMHTAKLLVVGWGSTWGHLYAAVDELNQEGREVALAHFNYISPLPSNTGEILSKFSKILVCELNLGQFANYLIMTYPRQTYARYNKMEARPFTVKELKEVICSHLNEI